jgi:polysaccharide export outer membrane protein
MQKAKRPDFPLQADDIIYVPFSYLKNFAVSGSGIAASAASAAIYRF